jgi:branched-chain amino acid aminotransferase
MTAHAFGSRIWINGHLADAGGVLLPICDRGFTLGDGIFETMLWTGTHVRFLSDHMARFTQSAHELGFVLPAPLARIEAGLIALSTDSAGAPGALRLTLTRGSGPRGLAVPDIATPMLIATIAPFVLDPNPVDLATVVTTRHAGAPSARFKTLSYIDNIMALAQARTAGADDAIMLGTTGNIACASGANLLIRHKGACLTPALEDGALPGIVRGRLLKAGLIEEARIPPRQLELCSGAALTNALIGVRHVRTIDRRVLTADAVWARSLIDALTR